MIAAETETGMVVHLMDKANYNRYRQLVKAIIKHTNIVSSSMNDPILIGDNAVITLQEWLVVEIVVEQREEYKSMVQLSREAGIPTSTFSRMVDHLHKVGLVEKYRVQGNKKIIVLRPTELALRLYEERTSGIGTEIWGEFYNELEWLSDDGIEAITNAINRLNERLPSRQYSKDFELIKVE